MSISSARHFELHELIDYVRGIGSPESLAAMRQHLEVDGCERCRKSATMLQDAYGAARALSLTQVPAAVVERAAAIFRPRPAAASRPQWWMDVPALVVDLVSGGGLQPVPVGLRSVVTQGQKVYTSGPVRVRVLQENDAEGSRALVGVISHQEDAGHVYAGCPVLLLAGEKVLVQAQTSRFGEFHLELPQRRNLRLVLLVDGESRRIEIGIED